MKKFPYYLEDWILWIGRCRDDLGNAIDFPYYKSWPISLANYDITFVTRSCEAILKGIGFTDRQIDTAVIIVTKYQKQITKRLGRDVGYLAVERPTRLETRTIDRSYTVKSCEHSYEVKFPYTPSMVDSMHKLSAWAAGEYRWDKPRRRWVIDKTERNLCLIRDFVNTHNKHQWQLDSTTAEHFAVVDAVRTAPHEYVPTLELLDGRLVVNNSNPHLDTALAQFDFEQDFANAAFRADNYGLTVGPKLMHYLELNHRDIATALVTSQGKIFNRSRTLDSFLTASNLKQFMETVKPKYWVFLTSTNNFIKKSEIAINANTDAEKIFFDSRSSTFASFAQELKSLNTNEIVVFSDNSMLTSRVWSVLESMNILRMIFLHGDK